MDTKIALIGTGGTIAGKGVSNTDLTGYTAGVLGLDEILASVPGTKPYGPYTYTQFSNIESSDITLNHWLELSKLVQNWLIEMISVVLLLLMAQIAWRRRHIF